MGSGTLLRKFHSRALLFSACIACLFLSPAVEVRAQSPLLLLTTEQSPPLNLLDDDGKTVRGLVADKIEEMMRRSHINYKIEMYAWNRALELARHQDNTCVFSTTRTAERETWFKWVGPVASGEWLLLGSPDKLGKITKLDQLKDARIGGYLGNAPARFLNDNGYQVVLSNSDDITVKNLILGHLDYWVSSKRAALLLIAKNNADGRVVPLFSFRTIQYYLACNPNTEDQLIRHLRVALAAIIADGTSEKIEAKY
jgi:polar amino acid transport system substrate-binding protein